MELTASGLFVLWTFLVFGLGYAARAIEKAGGGQR